MAGSTLIIGATSGIGRAVAGQMAQERRPLLLAGRDVAELAITANDLRIRYDVPVGVCRFEARDFAQHGDFFADCVAAAPDGLDTVVLCQGYMADQSEAAGDFSEVQAMHDVNFLSAASVLNLAADYFESRRSGCLCAVSSVASDRGRQSNYLYGASKAALDTFMQGLRHRMHRSQVSVVTVKPGFVDTRMTWGLPGLFLVAKPEQVARDISKAIARGKSLVYTPWFWRHIMRLITATPELVFHRTRL